MARQLSLLNTRDLDWRLDERTKAVGRQGISDARAALRRCRPPVPATAATAR